MKKTIGMIAGLFSLFAVQSASALQVCDNYSKTWDLNISGDSIVGTRDITDALGCGGTYTRGMHASSFGGTHFVLTTMEGNGGCVAVIWDGTWSGTSGSGTWYNNNGLGSGSFTLTEGACGAQAAGIEADPAE